MELKVFSVRDTKAQAFLQPFFSNSIGSALRAFSDAVADSSCPFSKHPEDYILYEIGVYDDSSGALMPLECIKMLGGASDFHVKVQAGRLPGIDPMELKEEAISNGKK